MRKASSNLGLIFSACLAAGAVACSPGGGNQDQVWTVDFGATIRDLAGTVADLATIRDLTPPEDLAAPDLASTSVLVGMGGGTTFTPQTLRVPVGTTVTWFWVSGPHTVTSGTVAGKVGTADGNFCNDIQTVNASNCADAPTESNPHTYSFKFTAAGDYPYFCRPHAGMGMTGTIVVQ